MRRVTWLLLSVTVKRPAVQGNVKTAPSTKNADDGVEMLMTKIQPC